MTRSVLGLGGVLALGGVIAIAVTVFGPGPKAARLADPRTLVWTHTTASPADARAVEHRDVASIGDRIIASEIGPWDPNIERGRGTLTWSLDGVTWQAVDGRIADADVTSLHVADGVGWVVADVAGPAEPGRELWSSVDGVRWERLASATGLDFGAGGIARIVGHGGTLVARGWNVVDVEAAEQILLHSGDGRDWQLVRQPRGPSYGLRSITGGPDGFVAFFTWELGQVSLVEAWHSDDGEGWTQHPMPVTGDGANVLDAAASDLRGYVAVGVEWGGRGGDLRPAGWTSANGRQWDVMTITDPTAPASSAMEVVVPAGSGFLALGRVGGASGDMPAAWATHDGRVWHPGPLLDGCAPLPGTGSSKPPVDRRRS